MGLMYNLGTSLARICFHTFAKWSVTGKEGIPPRGRLLVVANHLSYADPPVVAASLTRRTWFLAKRGLFRGPIVSSVMRAWGAYPLDRNQRDVEAIRWILRTLDEEKAVTVFPEGTRSPSGIRQASRGVAFIAAKSQTPILPIGITGTENISSIYRVPFPFCRINVNIGQPFSLPIIEGKLDDALLNSLTDMIMSRIAILLPENYRGIYNSKPNSINSKEFI